MQTLSFFAWLYWNPPLEAFRVPLIDRPVVWYGVLFVCGFVIGYFLFATILSDYFKKNTFVSRLDVYNWSKLIRSLQTELKNPDSFFSQVQDLDIKRNLENIDHNSVHEENKKTILRYLNFLISSKITDRQLLPVQLAGLSSTQQTAYLLTDRLLWFVVLGTVVGARLGHVFFYDWDLFKHHPLEIFKVWKGGLASHGGVIGVFIALYLFYLSIKDNFPHFSFLRLLDFVAIPSALAGCFIRLGNFMNQEIVGTPSQLPWAIVFGNAADGSLPIPRHPVQLYEAAAYLLTFLVLYSLWKTKKYEENPGLFVGLLFILVFGARFILEFWKVHQESVFETASLQAGQLLSIPFIFIGVFWVYLSQRNSQSI